MRDYALYRKVTNLIFLLFFEQLILQELTDAKIVGMVSVFLANIGETIEWGMFKN